MRKQEKIGYGLVVLAGLLMVAGSLGFVIEGEVNEVPTPNVPERTFFADEPLPENGLRTFISASLTLKWDRDDIYVVIVDEDKKNTCDATPPGLFNAGSPTACTAYDGDALAGGDDGSKGLSWDVQPGVHYVGLGTEGEALPAGTEVNVFYEVQLQAGFVAYFLFALLGMAGFAYTRVE
jgi:hypothetical protein